MMSKSKFLKKLLMGGLCALTATAMIGATACKPDNGGNDEPDPDHVHNYATTYKSDKDGHWHECLNAGHGKVTDEEKEAHVDADNNKKCDVCDYDMSTGSTPATEITVTFDLDGGSWSRENTLKLTDGKLPTNLPTPTKADKVFGGWLNGTTPVVPGVTVLTSNVTLKAKWTDSAAVDPDTESWWSGTGTGKVEANGEITTNDLFTITTNAEMEYTDLNEAGKGPTLGGAKIVKAIRSADEYATGADTGAVTLTANATVTVTVYVALADMTYNGGRSGAVYYYLNGTENVVMSAGAVTSLTDAHKTITVDLKQGDTLSIYAHNTNGSKARLWLFGAEAVENFKPTTVSYYYGDKLINRQLVADGATLEKPADPVNGENRFLGWYTTSACETEYTFGALTAGTTEVNIYADFQESDVTIEYYLSTDAETPWKTVKAFSGSYAEELKADTKEDGSAFLGWTTADGQDYDCEHTALVAGTLKLYAKYEAAPTEGVVGTYTYTVKKESDGSYSTIYNKSDDATKTAEELITDNISTTRDSETFKFGSNNDNLVIKIYVEAGSTITLNVSGYTGSSGKATGIKADAGTSKVTSNSSDNIIALSGSSSKSAIESGSIVFTATEDGLVTIKLARSVSTGAKVTELKIVVAKAAE